MSETKQRQYHSLQDLKQLFKANKTKCLFILGATSCEQVNNSKELSKLILKMGNLPIKKVDDASTAYLVVI